MANDYSQYTPANGFAGFDYNAQADAIKRRKEAAQALQQLSTSNQQGQVISNSMGTFYGGGNTGLGALAKIASAVLAAKFGADNDQSQANLDKASAEALAYNLSPGSTDAGKAAIANQQAVEDAAQLNRESRRTSPQDAPAVDASPAQTPPLDMSPHPGTGPAVPLPPVQSVNAAPVKKNVPAKKVAAILQHASAPNVTMSNAAGEQSYDIDGNPFGGMPDPGPSAAQQAAAAALQARPFDARSGEGWGDTPPQPQTAPQAPAALPPLPLGAPPQVQATPPQPQGGPIGDSRMLTVQASANAPQSQADVLKQILAIGRTGPMGQQIATAQLNQMFGSKNGRFSTDVKADTVNGGFVAVTTDSQTGRVVEVKDIGPGASGKTLVTGQTTDAAGNRLNIHKDGSTSPLTDANGKPVVDSNVIKNNDDQTMKVASAVQSNQNAQAQIDVALARNARILQLYHETYAGPIGGALPNWTAKRQELHSLLAQDLFQETRSALAGAGEAGGAPRMAQSEFKYMQNNGGLSQTTSPEAAENIIANMNAQLLAQKQAIAEYGSRLQGTVPGGAPVPGRGQTVSAADHGFH